MAIPVKETKEKIVVCAVCGAKLELNKLYHYIARDDGFTGAVTVFTKEQEEPMYDAFDCPVCGCQYIAQERKRTLFDVVCSREKTGMYWIAVGERMDDSLIRRGRIHNSSSIDEDRGRLYPVILRYDRLFLYALTHYRKNPLLNLHSIEFSFI